MVLHRSTDQLELPCKGKPVTIDPGVISRFDEGFKKQQDVLKTICVEVSQFYEEINSFVGKVSQPFEDNRIPFFSSKSERIHSYGDY